MWVLLISGYLKMKKCHSQNRHMLFCLFSTETYQWQVSPDILFLTCTSSDWWVYRSIPDVSKSDFKRPLMQSTYAIQHHKWTFLFDHAGVFSLCLEILRRILLAFVFLVKLQSLILVKQKT